MEKLSPRRIAVGVGLVVGLALIIVPVAYFATRPRNEALERPNYGDLAQNERIDCYPESKSGVDSVNRKKCEGDRGCLYNDQSVDTPCYYPREKGYRGTKIITREKGFRVHLEREGGGPFLGNIENIAFQIEEYGDGVLQFKVL